MQEYEVEVSMRFDAESPEDAVRQMVEWLAKEGKVDMYTVYHQAPKSSIESWLIDAKTMEEVQ